MVERRGGEKGEEKREGDRNMAGEEERIKRREGRGGEGKEQWNGRAKGRERKKMGERGNENGKI